MNAKMNPNNIKATHVAIAALAIAASAGVLSSCDNVNEEDRYIKIDRPTIARKVLIQEFTGINCVNCPSGADEVHKLQTLYPGSVIAVGMHPGGTGFSGPIGTFNLNSDLARVYYEAYQPSGFPAAVVDGQAPETNLNAWSGMVTSELSRPAPADISLAPSYDEATRTVTVEYQVKINNVYTQPLNINIWLVENGIIGPQKSGASLVPNYTHNHVLRTSLTGDWGDKLADSFIPEEIYEGSVSLVLDEKWKAENCELVGFLQNNSRQVEQAAEAPVVNE